MFLNTKVEGKGKTYNWIYFMLANFAIVITFFCINYFLSSVMMAIIPYPFILVHPGTILTGLKVIIIQTIYLRNQSKMVEY